MITFFKKLFKRGDFMTRADKWYYSKVIKTWLWSAFVFVIIAWVGTNLVLCALTTDVKSGGDIIYDAEPAILPPGWDLSAKIVPNDDYLHVETVTFDYYTDENEKLIYGVTPEIIDIDAGINLYRLNEGKDVYILSKRQMFANPDSTFTFYGLIFVTTITFNNFNTSLVEDLSYMFMPDYIGEILTTLTGIEKWDTSNVISMSGVFVDQRALKTLDLSGWDTRNVVDMSTMFAGCTNLQTIYTSENFVTTNVTSSTDMFGSCESLVGGNGTAYNPEHVDAEYARIDGGPNSATPGYFTQK